MHVVLRFQTRESGTRVAYVYLRETWRETGTPYPKERALCIGRADVPARQFAKNARETLRKRGYSLTDAAAILRAAREAIARKGCRGRPRKHKSGPIVATGRRRRRQVMWKAPPPAPPARS